MATKDELRQLSKAELYERATEQDLPGRSKMSRQELINALSRTGGRRKMARDAGGRWRHPARLHRARTDLSPTDVPGIATSP
ncbi:Rho termination factor N-terminal domain-containing protein [Streptomyces sp. NPDC002130]|uniref:Rho termination factor N-terminal domain-containing protein n=1 Tax=Streptomyces sp. NPDC002130 TaxID=3155568 RepID=UPI00331E5869